MHTFCHTFVNLLQHCLLRMSYGTDIELSLKDNRRDNRIVCVQIFKVYMSI